MRALVYANNMRIRETTRDQNGNALGEVIVLQCIQPELPLQCRDALIIPGTKNRVDVRDDGGDVRAAILWHAFFNRLEVLPRGSIWCEPAVWRGAVRSSTTHQKSPSACTGALDAHAAAKRVGNCSCV